MKNLSKKSRLNYGNQNTEYVRDYLSKRFGSNLIDLGGSVFDIFGIDFATFKDENTNDFLNINTSFQGKVRVTKWGMHFIYETCLFKPVDKQYSDFKIEPGRDARGVSDWYTCVTCTRSNIKFVKTNVVKERVNFYLNKFLESCDLSLNEFDIIEWTKNLKSKNRESTIYEECNKINLDLNNIKCMLPNFSKTKIFDLWNSAARSRSKDILLASYEDGRYFDDEVCNYINSNRDQYREKGEIYANKGVELHFKIDEGNDTWQPSLGKILVYIPYPVFPENFEGKQCRKIVEYRKGEIWNDSNTWQVNK